MTSDYRIEHDSMGALEVPSDALWGAKPSAPVNDFPVRRMCMPLAIHTALGLIKWAAASANHDLGFMSADMTDRRRSARPPLAARRPA